MLSKITVPWSRAGMSRCPDRSGLRYRAHHQAPTAEPTIPARIPRVRLLKRPPFPGFSWQSECHEIGPLFAADPLVRTRTLARPAHESSWPLQVSLTWLTVGVLTVFAAAGCHRSVPPLDTSPQAAAQPRGTISGTIRGPEGTTAVEGRVVDVIDVTTNRRQRLTTDQNGGFSVTLDPGDYRVVLTLLDGEAIVRQPGVIHVDRSDVDTDADFVIGTSRISRPRPAYKVDDGLGSPVA